MYFAGQRRMLSYFKSTKEVGYKQKIV